MESKGLINQSLYIMSLLLLYFIRINPGISGTSKPSSVKRIPHTEGSHVLAKVRYLGLAGFGLYQIKRRNTLVS